MNDQKKERTQAIEALTKTAVYLFDYLYDLTHADGRDEQEIEFVKKELMRVWQDLNKAAEA